MLKNVRAAWPLLALMNACSNGGSSMTPPMTCLNITGNVMQNGLTLRKPEADTASCHEVPNPAGTAAKPTNVCMKKDPDLTCVAAADPLGTPMMVTFSGCVAAFGLEAQSNDLTVTVFRETLADGTPTNPAYDVNGTPGMQAEKTPSALIGHTISMMVPESQCKDLGAFQLPMVPTETNLIVRVTDQHKDKASRQFVDTYQYNVILRNGALLQGPTQDAMPVTGDPAAFCASHTCYGYKEANTVFSTTFKSVALSAGVSTIRGQQDLYDGDGQGHVAGEIRDCTSVDRIQNAVVATSVDERKLTYFNVGFPPDTNDIDDPRPDQSRTRTNADGLYAAIAIDTPAGGETVTVGAAITPSVCGMGGVCKCNPDGTMNPAYTGPAPDAGNTTVLATRTIYALPDSITILSFDKNLYTKR
jgi:hypothetical protein